MFILRSAFWLGVGFLLVAPHGTDFGAAASAAKEQAITAGAQAARQIVVSEVLTPTVASAVVAGLTASTPSRSSSQVALPMQDSSTRPFVFPMPRPAALG